MTIIGENINATRPKVRDMIISHDDKSLVSLALRQEAEGAEIIDINVGTGAGSSADESRDMQWLIGHVREHVTAKICVDSADPAVLKAGLESGGESIGMINSVKATDQSIGEVMPLAAEYNVPVAALAMDDNGIPAETGLRIRACEKLAKGADSHGVPLENIFFDPIVMPISTNPREGEITLETIREIKTHFPVAKVVLAVSNVSFGLPRRTIVNQALVHMARYLGVDALLTNPLDKDLMFAIKAGAAVLGKDRHCRKYTRAARKEQL